VAEERRREEGRAAIKDEERKTERNKLK